MPPHVLPWSGCPAHKLLGSAGVLTDIDDTLTRDGRLEPAALSALEQLARAQIPVVAITGRPMGWSEPFARAWPVAAIVAENGAVALFRQGAQLCIEYAQDGATRAHNARRLREAADAVLRDVPGTRLATDSAGRVTDIAIDHSEHAQLAPPLIERVVRLLRGRGMNVTVSSIHINAWFGAHDKLSGARWIVRRLLGLDLDAQVQRWVYVGDSTNDQQMFGHFDLSVGVANLMRFTNELVTWPNYITAGERGSGFAEVAAALLGARRPPT
jgi:HAD superfamily hydrolase (TIGR01484 family)